MRGNIISHACAKKQKSPILVDILINFTFLVKLHSWKLISLLEHRVSTKITPHENIDPRNSLPAKARKFVPRNLVCVQYIIIDHTKKSDDKNI